MKIKVRTTNADDTKYVVVICQQIEESAKIRRTGIAKRDQEDVKKKITEGHAVIAFGDGILAGFSYIETFPERQFVANSGLIVFPEFRHKGVAKLIKSEIFQLSIKKFPKYKIFSITTNISVFKMNLDLGLKPVPFTVLPQSEDFWKGCRSCTNYDILTRHKRKMCLCSGLLYETRSKKSNKNLLFGEKILLAYSGGLDTSYCFKYLTQQGYKVYTAIVNTGGSSEKELIDIEKKAYAIVAKFHRNIEAKDDYYKPYTGYETFTKGGNGLFT